MVVNRETYGVWLHKQNILCFGPIIIMFLLSMFGSIREIVKELPIYQHERFINLRIVPYLLSKIIPLSVINAIQTFSVVLIINCFADVKGGNVVEQFVTLFLVALCGMLAGLAISASVKSSDWAVMLMIAAVVPQLLFAGALAPVKGASAFIAQGFISAYWALEALRTEVENYYISNHVGYYVLPERSQGWGFGTSMLLLHAFFFLGLTFFLMARKDGPGAERRILRSVTMLFDELRERIVVVWHRSFQNMGTRPAVSATTARASQGSGDRRISAIHTDASPAHAPHAQKPITAMPRQANPGANMSKIIPVIIGAIIGAIVGYPLSYFMQPSALRMKCSLGDYIGHISDILQSNQFAGTAIGTWIGSIVVFALLGLLVSFLASSKNGKL